MHAAVGDHLQLHSNRTGQPDRNGEIIEVRGPNGMPPYRVRWDNGLEDLIIPSSDATVRPARPALPEQPKP
ncbi:MAG TPA: DUF1918 domain-containing protein [Actinomycetes bacterium]